MKVLVVCKGSGEDVSPFVSDQTNAIKILNPAIKFEFCTIEGKGIKPYISTAFKLLSKNGRNDCDIIHAHYGLSALAANLQRQIPVVSTFHGSDINLSNVRKLSKLAMRLSARSIFVSKELMKKASVRSSTNSKMIPCGVNLDVFYPRNKKECRSKLNIDPDRKYALFASSFDGRPVKDPQLALAASKLVKEKLPEFELIELKGYSRPEVALLLNAVDCLLLTSFSEGSPQVVKEAVASNCPVVTMNVGDVKEILQDVTSSHIIEVRNPQLLAEALEKVILSNERSNGSEMISRYDNTLVAHQVVEVYNSILR